MNRTITGIIAASLLNLYPAYAQQDSLQPRTDTGKPIIEKPIIYQTPSIEDKVEEIDFSFNAPFCSNTSSKITIYKGLSEWDMKFRAFGRDYNIKNRTAYDENNFPFMYIEDVTGSQRMAVIQRGSVDILTTLLRNVVINNYQSQTYNVVVFENNSSEPVIKEIVAERGQCDGTIEMKFYAKDKGYLGGRLKKLKVIYDSETGKPCEIEGTLTVKKGPFSKDINFTSTLLQDIIRQAR